jgi:phosphate transport system protein
VAPLGAETAALTSGNSPQGANGRRAGHAEEENSVREQYREELQDINSCLVEMANSVGSAMSKATTALLDADVALADLVIAGDEHIDGVRESIEQRCFTLLARQQPVATDLRTITAAMRIVADLERMGDLAVHVAKLARMRFPQPAVPQEVRPTFLDAGHVAESLVTKTATVIATLDVEAATRLEAEDDLMDELHRQLFGAVLSTDWPHGIESAIDVTLLGRYYERFADHAVSVARRVVYLVTGERTPQAVVAGAAGTASQAP